MATAVANLSFEKLILWLKCLASTLNTLPKVGHRRIDIWLVEPGLDTFLPVWTSLFTGDDNKLDNFSKSVATASHQCILTSAGATVRIQCPSGGISPPTLLVWMWELVSFSLLSAC